MVDLHERILWMLLGGALGYIVRVVQVVIQGQLQKNGTNFRSRNDRGYMRVPSRGDLALLIVIAVTVWAAFASQHASNAVEKTQREVSKVSVCNKKYLAQTITALNVRTEYNRAQIMANANLQQSQKTFLSIYFVTPPSTQKQRVDALRVYFNDVNKFVNTSVSSLANFAATPYPTNKQLDECLKG